MAPFKRHQHPDAELDLLLEKAGIQGYLTTSDLMEVYPDAQRDNEQLSILLRTLRYRGVEIVDDEDDPLYLDEDLPLDNALARLDDHMIGDTIGVYLKEMAQYPLLTPRQEVRLAKQIEAARRAQKEIDKAPRDQITAVARKHQKTLREGKEARDTLIKSNTRLVVSIAKRYMGRGVPFIDLIQEGNIGLMKAVDKYNYKLGYRFSTYATWWIRQTITRAIADQARTIRLPVHMSDRIRQIYKARHELEQKLGRQPEHEEIAQAVGISVKKLRWIFQVAQLPLSLESPINTDEEDSELGLFIEDRFSPTPMQIAHEKMLREKLEEVLDTLPPREARIIKLRYGLEDGHRYTLEEVGQKFGLTRERIRQIETKALRRLRHPRRARKLKDYL